MPEIIKVCKRTGIIWTVLFGLLFIMSGGCNKPQTRIYVIGIIGYSVSNDPAQNGFMEGMAELGFVEDKNIKYIYSFITENNAQIIDLKIRNRF